MDETVGILRCVQYIDKNGLMLQTELGNRVGIFDNIYDKNGKRVSVHDIAKFEYYNPKESIHKNFDFVTEYWAGDYYKIGNKEYKIIAISLEINSNSEVNEKNKNGEDAFHEKFTVTVDIDREELMKEK